MNETMIKMAVSRGMTESDLKTLVQDEYSNLFKRGAENGWKVDSFKTMVSLTGVDVSESTVHDYYYESYATGRVISLSEARSVPNETGVPLKFSPEEIDELYSLYIENGKLVSLIELYNVTGVVPDVEDSVVKKLYTDCLDGHYHMDFLYGLINLFDVEPIFPKKKVEAKYRDYFNENDLKKFKTLHDITGIDHGMVPEAIQKKYVEDIKSHNKNYAEKWMECFGVGLSSDSLQTLYEFYIEKGHFGLVHDLRENYGEIPDKEYANKMFVKFLSDDVGDASSLKSALGFGPKLSENEIEDLYDVLLSGHVMYDLDNLKSITDGMPSEELVQKYYEKYISERSFHSFNKLKEFSGIDPGEEVYNALIDMLLNKEEVN